MIKNGLRLKPVGYLFFNITLVVVDVTFNDDLLGAQLSHKFL